MSWLAGIAGKAEELLNKVDQAAATSLNNPADEGRIQSGNVPTSTGKPNAFPNHSKSNSSGGQLTGIAGSISSSASVPTNLNRMNSSSQDYLSQMSRSTLATSRSGIKPAVQAASSTKAKDDELFEFLNSSDSTSESKKNGNNRPRTIIGNKQHSRHSSGSSAGSRGRKTPDGGSVEDNNSSPGTPGKYMYAPMM